LLFGSATSGIQIGSMGIFGGCLLRGWSKSKIALAACLLAVAGGTSAAYGTIAGFWIPGQMFKAQLEEAKQRLTTDAELNRSRIESASTTDSRSLAPAHCCAGGTSVAHSGSP
jgi:hypothetical protein